MKDEAANAWDFFWAAVLGVATAALLSLWSFPGLPPLAWEDAAAGALLRPPEHVVPGFARMVALGLYSYLPPAGAELGFMWGGRILLAVMTGVVYLLFRDVLCLALPDMRANHIWSQRIRRVVAMMGAMAFALSDPVWQLGQALTSDTTLLFLTVMTVGSFFHYLRTLRLAYFHMSLFFAGVLCAQSPSGILLTVVLVVGSLFLVDPVERQFSKWRMTIVFALGFLPMLVQNIVSFVVLHGWAASGWDVSDLIVKTLVRYGTVALQSATVGGWSLFAAFAVLPAALAVIMFSSATNEDRFLPYRVGIMYIMIAIFTLTQLGWMKPLWFWTWSKTQDLVPSPYLRGLAMFLESFAFMQALAVGAFVVFVRNNLRIVSVRFPELADAAGGIDRIAFQRRSMRYFRRIWFWVAPLLLLGLLVSGRRQVMQRRAMDVLKDYVAETVTEAGPATWIFTDGSFDPMLELESHRRGGTLRAVSLLGGHAAYDKYLRTRGVAPFDEENRLILENGAPDALRSWVTSPTGRVSYAVQMGFEFWKRGGKVPPPAAGVLVRPGMTPGEVARGVGVARGLASRLLTANGSDLARYFSTPRVKDLLDVVKWRLARVARLRAEELDRAGRADAAMAEMKASDALDRANGSLVSMLETINRKVHASGPQLTPREGLRLALQRADFALASRYAIPILNANPDDVEANFGMAMGYLLEKQYARAQTYFLKAIASRPKEPALRNNLALCLLNMNRLDEAEAEARKALAALPQSSEVKETLELIEKARKKQ